MPMYFPDLESVKKCAESMRRNSGDKKYTGIIPKTEDELPQAREELAHYFRNVWKDEIQAMEIELSVNESNYKEKISDAIEKIIFGR
jgi:hypothetical protein